MRTSAVRFPAPFAIPLLAAGLACAAGQGHAATLTVPLNHSVRLPVAGRAASVVVGNAAVADVTVVDSRTLYVTGKTPGSTDVAVVDPLGRTVYAADIAVSAGAGAAVTVHRAAVASEVMCDPRCNAAGQPKAAGMAEMMEGLAGMAAAKSLPSAAPTTTVASSAGSAPPFAPPSGGFPIGPPTPR